MVPNPGSSSSTVTEHPASQRHAESAISLVRKLVDELSTLLQQEIALATAEISRSISTVKTGVASVASGAAVLFAGFLFLLAAATLGLSIVLQPWLAALIVGAIAALFGFIMLRAGQKKLEAANFKPVRTQESLRRDKEVLQRRVS